MFIFVLSADLGVKLAYTQNVVELKKRKENRTTKITKKQNLTQFTKRKKNQCRGPPNW